MENAMKKREKEVIFIKETVVSGRISGCDKKTRKYRDKERYVLHKIQTAILCTFLIVEYDQKNRLTDRFFD